MLLLLPHLNEIEKKAKEKKQSKSSQCVICNCSGRESGKVLSADSLLIIKMGNTCQIVRLTPCFTNSFFLQVLKKVFSGNPGLVKLILYFSNWGIYAFNYKTFCWKIKMVVVFFLCFWNNTNLSRKMRHWL